MNSTKHQTVTWGLLAAIGGLLAYTTWSAMRRTVLLDDPKHPVSASGSTSLPDMRIDINSASVAELSVLPAIGPGLAERIVADREQRGTFESVDSLARVSGIGNAIIDRVRPYAVAVPPQK